MYPASLRCRTWASESGFWLRVLGAGVKPLDTVARWIGVVVLLLGIAGITVTFVFHLPWPLIVVILLGILLVVVAEGPRTGGALGHRNHGD
jgi:hypothetical protein